MNHAQLLKIAHALGYTPESSGITEEGLCKGFAMLWIRAVCSGRLEDFNKRLQILEQYRDAPVQLIEQINRSRKATDDPEFNEPFRQIYSFFDNVALFLHPDKLYGILGRGVNPHDEDLISAFVDDNQPEMKFSNCHRRVKNYNEQQLADHLTDLAKILVGQPGCAIEFNSLRHSVSAYMNDEGKFVFLDINPDTSAQVEDMEVLVLTPIELAAHLMQKSLYFDKKEEHLAMSTTVYARSDLKKEINAKFQEIPYKLTSNLDVNKLAIGFRMPGMAEAISKQDDFDVHADNNSLLMLAINYDNQEVVKAILHHHQFDSAKINFSYLACAFTNLPLEKITALLKIFAQAGLGAETMGNPIYSALLQHKKTDNHGLIRALLEANPEASKLIIKRLIADGHDFMRDTGGASPLHQEYEDAQLDLIKLFVDAGYDPNALDGTRFPLRVSLNSPKIVQFLLDNGADPQPNVPYVTSALDIACMRNTCPVETFKLLMKHDSTKLTMNQISANSLVYKTIVERADLELINEFVIKALQTYIKGIEEELVIGVFCSKNEKINAAKALLSNIQSGTPIDPIHNKALKDGRLSQIATLFPSIVSKNYRAKILEQRQEHSQKEHADEIRPQKNF